MTQKIITLLLTIASLTACQAGQERNDDPKSVRQEGDTIFVGGQSPILSRLRTDIVNLEPYRQEVTTSCEIKAIPSQYAEIASPFAGRINQSFVRLGQKVAPGTPIFSISSPDFFEAGKNYFHARQEMGLALKNYKREKDLFDNRVSAQKEVEEAEANYELAKQEFENARVSLEVYQIDPQDLKLGQPLVVRSPIAGEVVTDKIVMGQYIQDDAEPIAIIADLNQVWAIANVKEKDLHLIQDLESVEIQLIAMPDQTFSGEIYHVNEMLDPESRSVEVIIACDNHDRQIKPAMYGHVRLIGREKKAIRIPTSALLQDENSAYVLRSIGNNRFIKQPVTTGNDVNGETIVFKGLTANDSIVVAGAFYLLDIK